MVRPNTVLSFWTTTQPEHGKTVCVKGMSLSRILTNVICVRQNPARFILSLGGLFRWDSMDHSLVKPFSPYWDRWRFNSCRENLFDRLILISSEYAKNTFGNSDTVAAPATVASSLHPPSQTTYTRIHLPEHGNMEAKAVDRFQKKAVTRPQSSQIFLGK